MERSCYFTSFACFVLLICSAFAYPCQEQCADRITSLPGQPSIVNLSQYSGFITVNPRAGRALFYWLVESLETASSKPLVLWLNGGPGCSSIGYGAFEEVGPFQVQPDGKTLSVRRHAWNTEANILFLESPVGVGFSYSKTWHKSGDKNTAEDAYEFLVRWFERFPQYKYRDFFIAGESYAGHYIPQLSQLIVRTNNGTGKPAIRFKGFLLGNPVLDVYHDNMGQFEYWWSHGMISDSTYDKLRQHCPFQHPIYLDDTPCVSVLLTSYIEKGKINPYSIYTKPCKDDLDLPHNLKGQHPWVFGANDYCLNQYTKRYMNRLEVRKAFHANVIGVKSPWTGCRDEVHSSWGDSPSSVLPVFRELISAGYRIWVFSGDTDSVVPLTSTRNSIKALHLETLKEWSAWYDDAEVGGWSQVYKGLTYVTVRGAGHEVPLYRPQQALTMFKHFLHNEPLL